MLHAACGLYRRSGIALARSPCPEDVYIITPCIRFDNTYLFNYTIIVYQYITSAFTEGKSVSEREKSCCFSGHRPVKLPWGLNESDSGCIRLKDELAQKLENIYQQGYRHFICGMAIGCDMYFAEAVLALRSLHDDVTLEAAVPCANQSERWSVSQRERYNNLIDACDKVTVLQSVYTPDCMMRRNRYMVDNSSLLLCCYNGRPGGTMNTILYARRQGIDTIIIDI